MGNNYISVFRRKSYFSNATVLASQRGTEGKDVFVVTISFSIPCDLRFFRGLKKKFRVIL